MGRWARRVALGVALVAVAAFAVLYYHTRPAQLGPRAERELEALTGADVHVGYATLVGTDKVVLSDVRLTIPGDDTPAGRVLDVQRVVVDLNLRSLWSSASTVDRVVLEDATLHITEDRDTGKRNLARLPMLSGAAGEGGVPARLPRVELAGLKLRIGEARGGEYAELDEVQVAGGLNRHTDRADTYIFHLRETDRGQPSQTRLEGAFDAAAMSVRVDLSEVRLNSPLGLLLPGQLRTLWSRMRPDGQLPSVNVIAEADANGEMRVTEAGLRLEGVTAYLPIGEPGDGRRLTGVSGRLALDGERVRIDGLRGYLYGSHVAVNGSFGRDPASDPFSVQLVTDPFEVPQDEGFVDDLPELAQEVWAKVKPGGIAEATITLRRDEREGPVKVDGVVTLIDAAAEVIWFPYPVHRVRGRLVIRQTDRVRDGQTHTDTDLVFDGVTGVGVHGGRVRVDGELTALGPDPGADLDLVAEGLPLDEHLLAAMQPGPAERVQSLLHRPAHDRLVERGLIAADATSADGSTPVFQLGGAVRTAAIDVRREIGPTPSLAVDVRVDPAGLSLLPEAWAYPMTARSGDIFIDGASRVLVNRLALEGLSGAAIVLDGYIDREGGEVRPALRIEKAEVPIDPLLLATLGSDASALIHDLHAELAIRGSGAITAAAPGGPTGTVGDLIELSLDARVEDGRITPWGGRYTVDEVEGRVQLTTHSIRLEGLTGRRGDTEFTINGGAAWGTGPAEGEIEVIATGVAADAALVDLIPPQHAARAEAAELFEDLDPEGLFDASLSLAIGGERPDDEPASTSPEAATVPLRDWTLTLRPRRAAFTLDDTRIELPDVAGRVVVHADHLELDDLTAAFANGSATVSGIVRFDDATSMSLKARAQCDTLDDVTRAVLPDGVVDALDRVGLQCGYEVVSSRLYRRAVGPADAAATGAVGESAPRVQTGFDARIRLQDAQADVGVKLTDLTGELDARVVHRTGDDTPVIDLTLAAEQLRVQDRLIAPLFARAKTSPARDRLVLPQLRGTMYGGALVGEGTLDVAEEGGYRFRITMQEVELEPFLAAGEDGSDDVRGELDQPRHIVVTNGGDTRWKRRHERGLLSASLDITAPYDAPDQRQGRGVLEVRDARMFERPLGLAVLRAINFTPPGGDAFDRANARLLIYGDTVRFDSLAFTAPNLQIAGTGTMSYDQQKLDLLLFSRNPTGLNLGPITNAIDAVKDELVAIRVGGTLEDPDARVVSFKGVRDTWNDVFADSKARGGELDATE